MRAKDVFVYLFFKNKIIRILEGGSLGSYFDVSESIPRFESLHWCTERTNCCGVEEATGWGSLVALAFKDAQNLTPTYFPALACTHHQDTPGHQTSAVLKLTLPNPTSTQGQIRVNRSSPLPVQILVILQGLVCHFLPEAFSDAFSEENHLFLLQDPLELHSIFPTRLFIFRTRVIPSSSLTFQNMPSTGLRRNRSSINQTTARMARHQECSIMHPSSQFWTTSCFCPEKNAIHFSRAQH